jgi:hypothetical protein
VRGALLFAGAVLLALASQACSGVSSCSRDPDFLLVPLGNDPKTGSYLDGNIYRSAPFGGPYTHFPPFRTVTFEHGLHQVPYLVNAYLAFTDDGTLAESAGNLTEFPQMVDAGSAAGPGAGAWNDQSIIAYNNTCSDLYILVVAAGSVGGATRDAGSDPNALAAAGAGNDDASAAR